MLTLNLHGVSCAVDEAALRPESLAFLLEYGFKQYLQDGAAVSQYVMAKKGEPKDEKGRLLVDGAPLKKTDEELADERAAGVRERLESIMSGEFRRRATAERLPPEEAIRQDYIRSCIRAAAKAAKIEIPTLTGKKADPDWWQRNEANYYAKHRATVDKEVARRLKANQTPVEIDFI